jgi:cytoskeletal protein RodZ
LREARERRGISLRQIANTTKIGMSALEALERNAISRLPGGIFSRGFVRSYAVEVGLDPEATVREFIAQFPNDSVTAGHPGSTQSEDHEAIDSDRRTASTFARLIALSIPVAAAMIYFSIAGRPAPPPDTDVPALEEPSPPPGATYADSVSPVPGLAAAAAASPLDRLTITLRAVRECWVSVTVDGTKLFESLLPAGEQRTIEAVREVLLTAGDASAVTLIINGAEAKPLGTPGEVVTVRVDRTNFTQYVVTR